MHRARLLIASAVLTFAAAAPGADAVTNGVLDGNDHPNVGLFAVEHDGIRQMGCSGFYAGPRKGDPGSGVFVTAAHCLRGAEEDAPGLQPSQLVVTFDTDATYDFALVGDEEYLHTTATTWHPASDYDVSVVGDYGVIVLADPVAGLTPVQFPTARLLDQLAAKGALKPTTLFDTVGYGLAEFWPNRFEFPEGRTVTTSKFSGLKKSRLQLLANAKAGYGGACFFDSGAPVLRHQTNTVVAIHVRRRRALRRTEHPGPARHPGRAELLRRPPAAAVTVAPDTPFALAVAFIAEQPQPRVTVPARCALVGPTAVEVRLGGRVVAVDEPHALGGQGTAPTPEQYALAALGACAAITFRYWADRLEVRFDELRVDVRGEIDLRAAFGLAEGARSGYRAVRMTVSVAGPEPARYDEVLRAVDDHSPVLDVFRRAVAVDTVVEVHG